MQLIIEGTKPGDKPDYHWLLTNAARYAHQALLPEILDLYVHIEIVAAGDIDEFTGVVECDDEDEDNPRFFTLFIDERSIEPGKWFTALKTLFHEFVHIKQVVDGRLRNDKWNGKPLDNWYDGEYSDRPWEVEAEAAEYDLAIEFLKTRNISRSII